MAIQVRLVGKDDVALLGRAVEDVFDEAIQPELLAAFIAAPGHALVVAIDGGQLIGQARGIVHLQPDRPPELYIDNLGVTPRLQRRGIGTRLIERLLEWGREKGCTSVWVATEPDNDAALAFYSSLGLEKRHLAWFSTPL
ncbi:MAG: GNAT family N-acetyltransferase [Hyphomicrobiaceae bacterium]|nr:GNAT family N-acetyltransferase [Hyphomicrobiaceae bacterium]